MSVENAQELMTGPEEEACGGRDSCAVPALLDRVRELEAERDAALSTIAKVEALHQETACEVDCCGAQPMCSECGVQGIWPCETARALGSVPSTGEGNE